MAKALAQDCWIIVPAYNESKYIRTVLSKLSKISSQVIVIDDGSVDDTVSQAQSLATYVLRHRVNLGKGAALRTACDFAFDELKAHSIVMLDADDQHEASEVPHFWERLHQGNDVVFGVRSEPKHMPWLKRKVNRLSSFVTLLMFGRYIPDIPSGFKAFTKAGYQQLRWKANDYSVELEIAAKTAKYRLPFATVSIRTIYHDTDKGMTALDVLRSIRYLLKLKATL